MASRARFHDGGSGSQVSDGGDTAEGSLCSPGWAATMSGPFSPLVAEGYPDMLFGSGKANGSFLPQALDAVMESCNSVVETGDGDGESLPFIMIVDDNQINIKVCDLPGKGRWEPTDASQILAAYMSKLNHPYRSASNGQEAFEMYIKSPADYRCILTGRFDPLSPTGDSIIRAALTQMMAARHLHARHDGPRVDAPHPGV